MNIGLVVHDGRPEVVAFARDLLAAAEDSGLKVVGDDCVREVIDPSLAEGEPDVVVAVGGDGTMLAAAQEALAHNVPLFGFNLGTIGFLTEVEPDMLAGVLEDLAAGNYTTESRMAIMATLGGAEARGLNDVVVEKIDSLRLIHLEVEIDGEAFLTYRADGMIVSTPTGSTAYNFSAGGPLVDHSISALLMTPVASHSLFSRTIVLPAESVIRVTVRRERPARASVDKVRLGEAGEGDVVEIRRAPEPIRFIRFSERSFARAVTEKFELD